jgi:hypothetical protein
VDPLHTDQGELNVFVSEEKWKKTKAIVDRLVAVEEANRLGSQTGLETAKLLSDRGFLIYVSRAYPAMVPYLKGLHLTIDSWSSKRDPDGWRRTNAQVEAYLAHKGGGVWGHYGGDV